MALHSTRLSLDYPDLLVPYYFKYNFNILQSIADEFEIDLPELPAKKDYKGRVHYYAKLSDALLSFAEANGLTHYELYAFLYDFAPKYIGGVESYIVKPDALPQPKQAFFIGGDESDRL